MGSGSNPKHIMKKNSFLSLVKNENPLPRRRQMLVQPIIYILRSEPGPSLRQRDNINLIVLVNILFEVRVNILCVQRSVDRVRRFG